MNSEMGGKRRISRLAPGAFVVVVGCLAFTAPAQAAGTTYLVDAGGTDTGACTVSPCATIQYAIEQHRAAPSPGDVIDVGSGIYPENVDASDPADDDLTIRGTLDGSGTRQTTISGDSDGGPNCMVPCVVQLGFDPDINVALQDVNVDNSTADDDITPISIEGGSDLTNVHASATPGGGVFEILAMCANPGTVIKRSTIDATGTFGVGIDSTSGAKIRDSIVHSDVSSAILQFPGFGKRPYQIVRSQLSSAPDSGDAVLNLSGNLKLDSSLVTGADFGAVYQGFAATSWRINNTTIDVADPGVDNSPDDDDALALGTPDGARPLQVTVTNSLLVEDIYTFVDTGFEGPGTITCDHSNLPSTIIDSPWVDDCPLGGASTNTTDPPSDLFVGGPASSYDWQLKDDSPAIDAGTPGPVNLPVSRRDLNGNNRRLPGIAANCADPIRDKGAYEHAAVVCKPTLRDLPEIHNGSTPTVGTELNADRGRWFNHPTNFSTQWLRCQPADPDDCVAATPARPTHHYTPKPADAGFVLRIQVIASNAAGDSDPALSDPTGVVGP